MVKGSLLLNNITLWDAQNDWKGTTVNLLIKGGKVHFIKNEDAAADLIIDASEWGCSPGWTDLSCQTGEPGNESAETWDTLTAAAKAGGFTRVFIQPNLIPAIDNQTMVDYILQKGRKHQLNYQPVGALTKGLLGKSLAEMQDLYTAGVRLFSEVNSIQNADILLKSLMYLEPIGGLLINRPMDSYLSQFGHMHEGLQSTILGLKGIPSLAEELMIARDLKLLEYTGGRLHFSGISSARGAQLIREAKERGQRVTCDVAFHNLIFNDTALADFDTNLKLQSPLRSEGDRNALIAAVIDDTIDAIITDHKPLTTEDKFVEFDMAAAGATGLEQLFPSLATHVPSIGTGKLIEKLVQGPAVTLGEPIPTLENGQEANLTLFKKNEEWQYNLQTKKSKSANSVFLNSSFNCAVIGTITGGSYHLNMPKEAVE